MPHTWSDDLIFVSSLSSGDIRVGAYPAGAAGLARIPIPGGTVFVDPATPHCPPSAEIADAAAAAPVLAQLYGDPVARSVLEIDDDIAARDGFATREVAFVPSPALEEIAVLGTLLWLARYGSHPLHPTLLALETMAYALRCQEYFEDCEGPTDDLLLLAAPLVRLARTDPDRVCQQSVRDVVSDVLSSLSAQLTFDDPDQAYLTPIVLSTGSIDSTIGPSELDSPHCAGPPHWLDGFLTSCLSLAAVHASTDADGAVLLTGSCTPDWERNEPGTVARDEASATWSVTVEGTDRASVSVVASAAPPPAPVARPDLPIMRSGPFVRSLQGLDIRLPPMGPPPVTSFSIHSPAWPLPLVEGILEVHPQAGTLAGVAVAEGVAVHALAEALRNGQLLVDLHDSGIAYAHLVAPPAEVAEAHRWTARGVCAARLALGAPESSALRQAARSALVRAESLWIATGDNGSLPPELAAARAAHCRGLTSVLEPVGRPPGAKSVTEPAPMPGFAPALAPVYRGAAHLDLSVSERAALQPELP